MKMRTSNRSAAIAAASLLTAVMVVGCAGDTNDSGQEEIEALRQDLDQLTNAVGRLEFRIYELENYHPGTSGTVETTEVDDSSATSAPAEDEDNGLIDLTPVD